MWPHRMAVGRLDPGPAPLMVLAWYGTRVRLHLSPRYWETETGRCTQLPLAGTRPLLYAAQRGSMRRPTLAGDLAMARPTESATPAG